MAGARRARHTTAGGETAAAAPGNPLPFRIVNWIGIIDQLAATQANRVLKPLGLTLPQFVMLNHFSHRPDEGRTVSAIARALQQPQPGVTKTIQKLQARRWLREESHPEDGRSKVLFLTPAGLAKHAAAVAVATGALAPAFDGWSRAELEALFAQLDRLKRWLDENR